MFEGSLNRHTWQDYLHAVMELKHAPEHAAKGSALGGPFPGLMFPSLPSSAGAKTSPCLLPRLFPQQQMLVGAVPTDGKNPDVDEYGWTVKKNK